MKKWETLKAEAYNKGRAAKDKKEQEAAAKIEKLVDERLVFEKKKIADNLKLINTRLLVTKFGRHI